MKRYKGQRQKASAVKRQRSHTGDSKHASDNFQHDSEVAYDNCQQGGHENKEGTQRKSGISLEEHSLEIDAERAEQDTNADTFACHQPVSFKSNNIEGTTKLSAGFGFTPETSQYRVTENSKPLTKTSSKCSLNRHSRGLCAWKTVERHNKAISAVDGNAAVSKRNLAKKDVLYEFPPLSIDGQESLPEDTNSDSHVNESESGNQFCRLRTERIFKTRQLGTQYSVEMDVIYTRERQEEKLEQAPEHVPADYVDMSPKQVPTQHKTYFCMIQTGNQIPDQESNILIPHKNADKPEGDDFGAILRTFIEQRRNRPVYHRHFLVHVVSDKPAGQMGIENNDELVDINDVFGPVLTHTDVLNLFHHVPVDGNTRLSLVIRRVENKKKWCWIQTSAVLTADKSPDEGPVVEYPEYKRFKGERYEMPKSKHFYKVPGTQEYLDMSDSGIRIGRLHNDSTDKTKVIWKRCVYWVVDKEGHIDFAAALSDETMKWYIGIHQNSNAIILKNGPEWFKMITSGSNIRFQFKDQYLGYDRETGQVKALTSNCVFEELPASELHGVDTLNTGGTSKCVQENSSETDSTNMIQNDSTADNGYETPFSQSSRDSFSSSQKRNSSAGNSVRMFDGTDTSGYNSESITPPESLDTSSFDFLTAYSGTNGQSGPENGVKTPTTPMQSLSLSLNTKLTNGS